VRQGADAVPALGAGPKPDVPTAGEFIKEMDAGFDAETYDIGYEDYAKPRMW
jgi:hypothetical protein